MASFSSVFVSGVDERMGRSTGAAKADVMMAGAERAG
jgi:hypothetical protein